MESRAQGRVARPPFVQLTQAGPSLSPADSKAGSPEVTGQGRDAEARGSQRGAASFLWQHEFLESGLSYLSVIKCLTQK